MPYGYAAFVNFENNISINIFIYILDVSYVSVVEEPLLFVRPLQDQNVLETQIATLECEVSKPDQAAVWRKGSLTLKTGGKYEIRVDATKHTLVIQDTQLDDQAEYTVVFGDKTSSATVFVEGRLTHSGSVF